MAGNFQPPPTWTLPVDVDATTGRAAFNPVWLKWFVDLTSRLTSGAGTGTVSSVGISSTDGLITILGGPVTTAGTMSLTVSVTVITTTGAQALTNKTNVESAVFKPTAAAGYHSSDGSTGYTGTVTTASLVGKTITIKDGIITGFA